MKRKIITAILAITVVFSAASCGTAGSKSSNIQSDTQEATVSDTQNSTERTSETAGEFMRCFEKQDGVAFILN